MNMATITGGSVGFEQSRKLAEYENRKATITFNVSAVDGEDASTVLDAAFLLAQNKVFTALGLKPVAVPASVSGEALPTKDTHDAAGIKEANAGKLEGDKKKPGRPPKVAPVAEVKVDDVDFPDIPDDLKKDKPQISTGEERKDPADDEWGAEVAAVTDLELTSKINHKNGELRKVHGDAAAPKIRQLIGKYVTPPKQARDIPAEARAKFIEDLAALA
jgi:hypothetical protein